TDRVGDVVIDSLLNETTLTVTVPPDVRALGLGVAKVDAVVTGTLGQFAGTAEGTPTIDVEGNLLGIISLASLLGLITPLLQHQLLTPLTGVVGPLLTTVTDDLTPTVDGVVAPVLEGLSPVLSGVIAELVSVTINEQPDPGYLGDGSFTVNAVSLELLPNVATNGAVNIDLASSTVRALDEVLAPMITADPSEVPAGETTAITGADYPANTEVSVQLKDADGNNVGDPVAVTTDAEGGFTTDLTVPEGAPAGEGYQVVGTAEGGLEAS